MNRWVSASVKRSDGWVDGRNFGREDGGEEEGMKDGVSQMTEGGWVTSVEQVEIAVGRKTDACHDGAWTGGWMGGGELP